MTHEEAIRILDKAEKCRENPLNDCVTCSSCEYAVEEDDRQEAHRTIVDRYNKYRWHDLRKDPDDLPDENHRIMFLASEIDNSLVYWTGEYLNSHFCNDDYEGYFTDFMYDKSKVIAWRHIEPFEVEE